MVLMIFISVALPAARRVFYADAKGHFSMDTKRFIQNNAHSIAGVRCALFDADNDKDLTCML
jgi:hypothetical protein